MTIGLSRARPARDHFAPAPRRDTTPARRRTTRSASRSNSPACTARSAASGLIASSSCSTPARIRFRRSPTSALLASSHHRTPASAHTRLASPGDTPSIGRITRTPLPTPLDGAIPANPRGPEPRKSASSTVSSWSCPWCPVAIHATPAFRASRASAAYRNARAFPSAFPTRPFTFTRACSNGTPSRAHNATHAPRSARASAAVRRSCSTCPATTGALADHSASSNADESAPPLSATKTGAPVPARAATSGVVKRRYARTISTTARSRRKACLRTPPSRGGVGVGFLNPPDARAAAVPAFTRTSYRRC